MIARAPIAGGSIAGRRRRSVAIGADFVVPFAAIGLAALDRRGMSAGAGCDEAMAGDRDRLDHALRGVDLVHAGAAPADATARSRGGVVRVS
ncbi:MAG: hypothetical protein ACK4GG_11965 [Sphingomonas sp.]